MEKANLAGLKGYLTERRRSTIVRAVGKHRTTEVMRDQILKYVANDILNPTRVETDNYPAYNFLEEEGYEHIKVNHSRSFGKGIKTTNKFESTWSQIKSFALFNKG